MHERVWQTFAIQSDLIENPTADRRLLVRTNAVGYADGTQLHWHAHDWHQLVYASAGVLLVETETGAWIVPPARAVWVPANVTHRLTARGKVQLRTVYVARHLRAAAHRLGVIDVSPLLRELILHIVQRGMLEASSAADTRLSRVLLDQLQAIDVVPLDLPAPTDPIAEALAAQLQDSPGADLDALAHGVGASRRTLERRFREQTGMSLGRWRQRLQLLRAIELLASGASVSEAGWAVGYASTSSFVTAFRRQLGTTPGHYFS
jgi:AraC-like DNA-binding protein/mannose-6-phosphate isomerase-like protein (cupin superfamily)